MWEDDSGASFDEDTGVWLVFNGVERSVNSPQGEWGAGFMLSRVAHKLWKKSGEQMCLISPRVMAIRLEVNDKDGKSMGVHFVHGRAVQQDASIEKKGECYSHLDEGLDARKPGDFVFFTTDSNCSVGARADNDHDSVRGDHGEPHRNPAGDFLHVWAGQRHLFAATTSCPGRKPIHGRGAWRHPRTKKARQNDHVFVQNGRRHRALQCKYSSPL